MSDAYFANTCLDFPVAATSRPTRALAKTFRTVAPHFRAAAYNDLPVRVLARPAAADPGARRRAPGRHRSSWSARPLDPATPYAWAKSLAKQLESGVLITRKGDGHTAYLESKCVDKAVDGYLLELTVPKDGLVCGKTD